MKRRVAFLVLLLIPALLVCAVACAAPGSSPQSNEQENGENGSQEQEESAADGPVTLSIGGNEYNYTPAIIEEFENRNPDINVEFTPGSTSFEDGTIQATLRSGTGPDIMIASSGPGRVGRLSDAGLILSLEEIYAQYDIEERYQDWVIDQIRTQGDGEIFEIVEGVDVFQVYYNKQIFEDVGIDTPETWEDFLNISFELQENGIKPIALGVNNGIGGGWFLGNVLEASAGVELMSEVIYGEGRFDQDEIILGAEMYAELAEHGFIDAGEAASIDQNQAIADFENGGAAMKIMRQADLIGMENDGTDISQFDTFLMPSRDEGRPSRPTAGLAHSWFVSKNADHLDAVGKWMEWVSSEDYLRIAVENGAVLVPIVHAAEELTLHPATEDAIQQLEEGAGYNPSVYLPAGAIDAWYSATQGILTGEFTPEEAMQLVQEELEANR